MTLHSTNTAKWDAAVETFNGTVVLAYQTADQYGTDKMIFDGRPPGESVNYPVLGNMIARNEEDGEDVTDAGLYSGPEDDITTKQMDVDEPLKEVRLLPRDQIEVRPDLRLPDNYAKKLGRAVALGKHIRVQNLLATEANTEGNEWTVDGDESDANVIIELKTAFNEIGAQFDEDGIPQQGRHIMLKSNQWYKLLGAAGIITKEYGGQANVQRPGEVLIYANWMIHNGMHGFGVDYSATPWNVRFGFKTNSTKYDYDATNLLGVAWHSEAWALRHWVNPTTDIDWVTLRNSYKIETRMTMGAVVIQPKGTYAILDET